MQGYDKDHTQTWGSIHDWDDLRPPPRWWKYPWCDGDINVCRGRWLKDRKKNLIFVIINGYHHCRAVGMFNEEGGTETMTETCTQALCLSWLLSCRVSTASPIRVAFVPVNYAAFWVRPPWQKKALGWLCWIPTARHLVKFSFISEYDHTKETQTERYYRGYKSRNLLSENKRVSYREKRVPNASDKKMNTWKEVRMKKTHKRWMIMESSRNQWMLILNVGKSLS